jgi:hypothetical protein
LPSAARGASWPAPAPAALIETVRDADYRFVAQMQQR